MKNIFKIPPHVLLPEDKVKYYCLPFPLPNTHTHTEIIACKWQLRKLTIVTAAAESLEGRLSEPITILLIIAVT